MKGDYSDRRYLMEASFRDQLAVASGQVDLQQVCDSVLELG